MKFDLWICKSIRAQFSLWIYCSWVSSTKYLECNILSNKYNENFKTLLFDLYAKSLKWKNNTHRSYIYNASCAYTSSCILIISNLE